MLYDVGIKGDWVFYILLVFEIKIKIGGLIFFYLKVLIILVSRL